MNRAELILALFENHHLAGLYVADELGSYEIKRAGFARDDVAAVFEPADAERTHAVAIAHGKHLRAAQDQKRVRAHALIQSFDDAVF